MSSYLASYSSSRAEQLDFKFDYGHHPIILAEVMKIQKQRTVLIRNGRNQKGIPWLWTDQLQGVDIEVRPQKSVERGMEGYAMQRERRIILENPCQVPHAGPGFAK
jgi:hypothetical protein